MDGYKVRKGKESQDAQYRRVWIEEKVSFLKKDYICSVCGGRVKKPVPTCPHCETPIDGSLKDPEPIDPVWFD